jgi:hypothetical protein
LLVKYVIDFILLKVNNIFTLNDVPDTAFFTAKKVKILRIRFPNHVVPNYFKFKQLLILRGDADFYKKVVSLYFRPHINDLFKNILIADAFATGNSVIFNRFSRGWNIGIGPIINNYNNILRLLSGTRFDPIPESWINYDQKKNMFIDTYHPELESSILSDIITTDINKKLILLLLIKFNDVALFDNVLRILKFNLEEGDFLLLIDQSLICGSLRMFFHLSDLYFQKYKRNFVMDHSKLKFT